jgi:PIN domain nuclease of toxin-antitoxin system
MIYLDTHVVAWLYAGIVDHMNSAVTELINTETLLISPMVMLELEYLFETGRTADPGTVVYQDLQNRIGLQICNKPFSEIIFFANDQKWTRDPFDRIIVAQAALDSSLLITKDRLIREHYPHAFWNGK